MKFLLAMDATVKIRPLMGIHGYLNTTISNNR